MSSANSSALCTRISLLAAAASLFVMTAHAVYLLPNTTVLLAPEAEPSGASIVASTSYDFTAQTFSGTLISTVWENDISNPFGGLTFTYQLTNSSASIHAVGLFNLTSFSGFETDVAYSGAGIAPLRARRVGTDLIRFFFEDVLGDPTLTPGTGSTTLVIQTDATVFYSSIGGVIDGSTADVVTFAPTLVPEPGSLSLALLGLTALLHRRSRR
jgi:hypothetical protein